MDTYFKDQEEMNEEQRINLINQNLVDFVYNAAYLEGVRMSFVEARAFILNGEAPKECYPMDLLKVENLKTIYSRLKEYDFIHKPSDLDTLCHFNRIINGRGLCPEMGRVRTNVVTISGTDFVPPVPDPYEVNNSIIDIIEEKATFVERGLDLYCYLMRTQTFIDGNKRTANVFANQFLLRHGQGMFSIRPEHCDKFRELLIKFYETNDSATLKKFLYDNCFYTNPQIPER